ncbi:ABC transporter ATP-binding protein [Leptospira sp. GIMC2001]|uniref:ABC transporter ATP-binding protein n=1 Tax=Leptospira sp. GIMC2001 TaxID=1513297 RepID=UPI00234B7C21|nr:ABC transporter ATP-binding protein [Leptospira sp. GIMC2001]WCL48845.1 ABC transporter ATP-binding protein [Leptospira sp. GIMC2001]
MNEKINIQDLEKNYLLGSTSIPALRGIKLQIHKGSFTTLMGQSGSGKSSLLNILASIDKPDRGVVEVFGQNISELNSYEIDIYRRTTVGIIFQFFNLLPYLTAKENVALPLYLSGVSTKLANKKSLEALELVGLQERIKHKPNELSGGEQQRVAIARSIVHDPKLLLADEPTGNLDTENSEKITNILINLKKEKNLTILIVTHNPEIGAMGEKQIRMQDGRIINE